MDKMLQWTLRLGQNVTLDVVNLDVTSRQHFRMSAEKESKNLDTWEYNHFQAGNCCATVEEDRSCWFEECPLTRLPLFNEWWGEVFRKASDTKHCDAKTGSTLSNCMYKDSKYGAVWILNTKHIWPNHSGLLRSSWWCGKMLRPGSVPTSACWRATRPPSGPG